MSPVFSFGLECVFFGFERRFLVSGIGNGAREGPELAEPWAGVGSGSWLPAATPVPAFPAFPPAFQPGTSLAPAPSPLLVFPSPVSRVWRGKGLDVDVSLAKNSFCREIFSRGSWKMQPLAATSVPFKCQPLFGLNLLLFNLKKQRSCPSLPLLWMCGADGTNGMAGII